jgi:aryl-alcohol dehydrogenase-like predicted oxidoreductase
MHYTTLGRTGLKVSRLCLGTMTFGSNFYGIGQLDEDASFELVRAAWEAGINFIDTADIYSYGESEQITGTCIRRLGVRRDEVVIATKVHGAMSQPAIDGTGDLNNRGLSRHHIIAGCEASLRRLGTDWIDLYQCHGQDLRTPLEETLRALEDLVRSGKVRYVGVSNWSARQLGKALGLQQGLGWDRFVSHQAYWSVVGRDVEHEVAPQCLEEGLAFLAWSPLAGGALSGKFRRGEAGPADARRSAFDFPPTDKELAYELVDAMGVIAMRHDATVAQVALAWLLAQPALTSVIIGAKRRDQFDDNLGVVRVKLAEGELAQLSAIAAPPALYPGWMIAFQNGNR